jgi:hypothetical protein
MKEKHNTKTIKINAIKAPKSIHIKKVTNGYTIHKHGGKNMDSWEGEEHVAKSLNEAIKKAKEHLI